MHSPHRIIFSSPLNWVQLYFYLSSEAPLCSLPIFMRNPHWINSSTVLSEPSTDWESFSQVFIAVNGDILGQ